MKPALTILAVLLFVLVALAGDAPQPNTHRFCIVETQIRIFKLDTQTGQTWAYFESKTEPAGWLQLEDYISVRTNIPDFH